MLIILSPQYHIMFNRYILILGFSLIVVLLTFSSGYAITCTDSDGGNNDDVFGIVTVVDGEFKRTYQDTCVSGYSNPSYEVVSDYIQEWWCGRDSLVYNETSSCHGGICYKGECKKYYSGSRDKNWYIESYVRGNKPFCIDVDNGINLSKGAGAVSFDGSQLDAGVDACDRTDLDIISDYICSNGKIEEKKFRCSEQFESGFRCSSGACYLDCSDSDNGVDIYTYGQVTAPASSRGDVQNDRCTEEGRLIETSCFATEANKLLSQINVGTCQEFGAPEDYYCDSGKCVKNESYKPEATCTDSDGLDYYTNGIVNFGTTVFNDFCNGDFVNEYGCSSSGNLFQTDYNCKTENKVCYNGACTDPSRVPENTKPKSEIKSVTLQTDQRVFGPKVRDIRVGEKLPTVGNNRPKNLNQDNGVLSDLDPWECKIEFVSDPQVGSADFSIKNNQNTLFTGKVDCTGNVCTGIIPREAVPRGEEVKCIASVNVKEVESNRVKVAKALFILTQDFYLDESKEIYLENFTRQFDFFLRRTVLQDGEYKIITREKGECPTDMLRQNFIRITPQGFTGLVDCAKKLQEFWNNKYDTVIYLQKYGGGLYGGVSDSSAIGVFDNSANTIAHEMGHRYGRLIDEHSSSDQSELGYQGDNPVCCAYYEDTDTPYYSIIDSRRVLMPAPKIPGGVEEEKIVHKINCNDQDIDGGCVEFGSDCGADKTDHMPFSHNCNDARCCVNKLKVGNNCYPPNINGFGIGYIDSQCAGMPLNGDGSHAILSGSVPPGKKPKPDIDAQYRSIMGAVDSLEIFGFLSANIIYPQIESGLPWPLKAGAAS